LIREVDVEMPVAGVLAYVAVNALQGSFAL
jgi:hypothetical protein